MTIVIPQDYHAKDALEKGRVHCVDYEQALHEDIRALRIGILNIMPKAETYEFNLLHPLGRSVLQIEPVFIRLHNHRYSSTNIDHLDKWYIPFIRAIQHSRLDGLIITGAPVEEIPFSQITYWDEIVEILTYARKEIPSTLGICWGGLALGKALGLNTERTQKKIFGVYETRNLNRDHPITGDLDDIFWCPQSRHATITDSELEAARKSGIVNLLAYNEISGYTIFESSDSSFLAHTGHPEYSKMRLIEEYERDKLSGRTDVDVPDNLDIVNPVNRWRGHRTEFFSRWIKYIHNKINY